MKALVVCNYGCSVRWIAELDGALYSFWRTQGGKVFSWRMDFRGKHAWSRDEIRHVRVWDEVEPSGRKRVMDLATALIMDCEL